MKLQIAEAKISLVAFIKIAWPIVEPSRQLVWGWHLDAVAEHLEAAMLGQINHLLITVPPGCTKTKITGTFLPAWVWLRNPAYRWLFVSNADELATAESMVCRRLVDSDWYRHSFGIDWQLRDDQDQKSWFENTAGGHRLCKGIGSNVTGRKGDCIIVDDANDAQKVQSEAERKRVNSRFDDAIYDRVIDFKKSPRIVIGQRTHQDDLLGHLKNQGGWEELCIPEEFNPNRRSVTSIGWTDPRQHSGELLRPAQFGITQIRRERRNNLMMYQAKHLQEPRSTEGMRFKSAWFTRRWRYDQDRQHIILADDRGEYRFHPMQNVVERYGTADGAASASSSADYTVISSWCITDRYDLVWLGCKRVRAEIPEQPDLLEAEYRTWNMQWCGVEAALSNRALLQLTQRRQLIIRELKPDGDKLARATPAIVLAESGRIWMPDEDSAQQTGFPLGDVLMEILSFTGDPKLDDHDDCVDTLAYSVKNFNDSEPSSGDGGGFAFIPPQSWHDWMGIRNQPRVF